MKTVIKRILFFILFSGVALWLFTSQARAYTISEVAVKGENDFVLEPGKAEFFLDPGQSTQKDIFITNRTNHAVTFKVQVEDFVGTNDPTSPVMLLEGDRSPYSFKDELKPEVTEFTLQSGQKITLPIKIEVPVDRAPGGYYSSVLISNEPTVDRDLQADSTAGRTKTVSRLGVLFFVRVNGLADEQGMVEDFRIQGPQQPFYQNGPFTFEVLFNNTGTVHLVPYGSIEVRNMLGKVVKVLPIDAYFSLPHSMRYREIKWDSGFLLGRYTAHLVLNRGYDQLRDEKTLVIWVVPWRYITFGAVIVFVILGGIYYVRSNFELRRKQ